jgi:hypothetical protein
MIQSNLEARSFLGARKRMIKNYYCKMSGKQGRTRGKRLAK